MPYIVVSTVTSVESARFKVEMLAALDLCGLTDRGLRDPVLWELRSLLR